MDATPILTVFKASMEAALTTPDKYLFFPVKRG
jgi:hypothetical protein